MEGMVQGLGEGRGASMLSSDATLSQRLNVFISVEAL